MTTAQVKETESITRDIINRNQDIYATVSPLAIAKDVQGLRAIFDEVYPDPVRVISIGHDLQQLQDDPQAGYNTSVEFCGGTHLKRTGDMQDFAIVAEEAISKGIRRIVAVSGQEAIKAHKKAASLEDSISELKQLIDTQTKENTLNLKHMTTEIVKTSDEVTESIIPYWKKNELRESLKATKKIMDDADKAAKAGRALRVAEQVADLARQNADKPFLVHQVEDGCNAKALDAALKQVKTNAPDLSAMFFSVDHDTKKVLCLCAVPKGVIDAKGLKANEWVQKVSTVIGGKGGGKPLSAQGSGDKIGNVTEAMDLATEFAKLKLQGS